MRPIATPLAFVLISLFVLTLPSVLVIAAGPESPAHISDAEGSTCERSGAFATRSDEPTDEPTDESTVEPTEALRFYPYNYPYVSITPRLTRAAVRCYGEMLTIRLAPRPDAEIAPPDDPDPASWIVRLDNSYSNYTLTLADWEVEEHGRHLNINMTAKLPPAAHRGLYDLVIQRAEPPVHRNDASARSPSRTLAYQPDAVMLRAAIPDTLTIVHITDAHLNQRMGGSFDDSVEYFSQLVEELNIIGPDIVIDTGDQVDANVGGNQTKETLKYLELVRGLEAPLVTVPGNHEYSYPLTFPSGHGIDDYRTLINPELDYSFDIGPYHFVMLSTGKWSTLSGDPDGLIPATSNNVQGFEWSQIQWLLDDLAANMDADQRIVSLHAPAASSSGRGVPDRYLHEFRTICESYDIPIVLAGHRHGDEVLDGTLTTLDGDLENDTIPPLPLYIQTRPCAEDRGTKNGYRVVRVTPQHVRSYSYDTDGDGARHAVASTPLTLLHREDRYDNESGVTQIAVENGQNERYEGATMMVEVPMLDASQRYEVSNATVVDWYTNRARGRAAYLIETTLTPQSNVTVMFTPVASTPLEVSLAQPTDTTAVPVGAQFILNLTAPLHPPTLRASNLYLVDERGERVAGERSYNATTNQISFEPVRILEFEIAYELIVTSALEDVMGNAAADASVQFTTQPPGDGVPPLVVATDPAHNQLNVPVTTTIEIAFSEALAPHSLTNRSVRILDSAGVPVEGQIRYTAGATTISFDPAAALTPFTTYRLDIGTAVTDSAGNALRTPYRSSFITAPAHNRPPAITHAAPRGPVVLFENASMRFRIDAWDPNADALRYQWSLDGDIVAESDSSSYRFEVGYRHAGVYTLTVRVNDRQSVVPYHWTVTVHDVNRPPVIDNATPARAVATAEGMQQRFGVLCTDPDDDTLSYRWFIDGTERSNTTASMTVGWNYTAARGAPYRVGVEVSDGSARIGRSWTVTVAETNRPPLLVGALPRAGSTIALHPEETRRVLAEVVDPDGEPLTGQWLLRYDGAEHIVPVTWSHDGRVANLTLGPTVRALLNISSRTAAVDLHLNCTDGAAFVRAQWTISLDEQCDPTPENADDGGSGPEEPAPSENGMFGGASKRTVFYWTLGSGVILASVAIAIRWLHRQKPGDR